MNKHLKKTLEHKSVFILPSKHHWWILQLAGKKKAEQNGNNINFLHNTKTNVKP